MSFLLKKILIAPILDPKQDIFRNFAAQMRKCAQQREL